MNLGEAVKTCFTKYYTFSGRASRSEFWWFVLFLAVISSLIQSYVQSGNGTISVKIGLNFYLSTEAHWLENLFTLTTLVPFIAALTRRLHDIGTSGWRGLGFFALLALIIASFFVLPWQISAFALLIAVAIGLFFLSRKSDHGTNQYGPNPYEVAQ
ncbi:DUF805 domain-containing protein [Ruegeria sp.]|uniref:DUF805 domain-containing protein n=1 Tax=Ruegeria sp. TaxID=1879320 RepID=UPI00231C2C9A|nr:DUF805 domain-containing protein [Ruegeria sp.]MDA7966106.1 DUF805 domain-containing protein [Ruegeria sp.]